LSAISLRACQPAIEDEVRSTLKVAVRKPSATVDSSAKYVGATQITWRGRVDRRRNDPGTSGERRITGAPRNSRFDIAKSASKGLGNRFSVHGGGVGSILCGFGPVTTPTVVCGAMTPARSSRIAL